MLPARPNGNTVTGRATFALDTSCMVAAVCAWHEHHAAAAHDVRTRLERGDRLTVAAHALVETYAVLTRLPPPHRLSPSDAWTLVRENFIRGARVVALSGGGTGALLKAAAGSSVVGGQVYDAVIAACARQGRADALLTFNRRHFDHVAGSLQIVEPGSAGLSD